jgi:amidase
MSDLPIHFQSLSSVCRQLKSGALSSVELTRSMLARCESLDAELHSYARMMADTAIAEAEACDKARLQGEPLGALHGVPVAIKDLLFTKDAVTASGNLVMQNYQSDIDATVVTRLRAAGAVIIGKTQLTEGAYGSHHPALQAPVNPWSKDAWSGVSSSGSGVAVAAGLAFAALGSDTGGSIRFPSACNGLVGLKPTYGRVSLHGAFPLANSLDHIGPMTRSVEDAARMLGVIAGFDANDPNSANEPVPAYLSGMQSDQKPLVVGVDWSYVSDGVPNSVTQVIHDSLAKAGVEVEVQDIVMPETYRRLAVDWGKTCAVECLRAHAHYYPAQASQYGPGLTWLLELGRSVSAQEYAELQTLRDTFRTQLEAVFAQVDVMLAPTMPLAAPSVAEMEEGGIGADSAPFLSFTAPFDYSGHPTLNVPAGLDGAGMPRSLQLVAARFNESKLLAAGALFENALGQLDYPKK